MTEQDLTPARDRLFWDVLGAGFYAGVVVSMFAMLILNWRAH